jgi:hypothetical protein
MQTQGVEAALAEMRIAPLNGNPFYHCNLLWMLVEFGDFDAALREKKALLELWPDFENSIAANYGIWGVGDDIKSRTTTAWRSVGFNVTE